ncbi:MAG: hypothetical protein Q9224_005868 [Gallowayella concinna]
MSLDAAHYSFSDPSNSMMGYEDIFPGTRDLPLHRFQPSHEHRHVKPTMKHNESLPSSRSGQDGVHDLPSFTDTSSTGFQSNADPTSAALPGQCTTFGDFNQAFDFGNLYDFHSSQSPYTGTHASTSASTASNLDNYAAIDANSFTGARSVPPKRSGSTTQLGMVSCCSQNDPKEKKATCTSISQNCLSSALEMLQTLHVPPTICLSTANEVELSTEKRHPRPTDSVLATNRTAVRRLSEILRCSCISSSQLQLVLVITCDKLLAWYRAVLHSFPGRCQDASSNAGTDENDASERVLYQGFAVGECSFGADLESKICAQVIASELQQLETLVLNLTDWLQEQDSSGAHAVSGSDGRQSTLTIDAPGLSSTTRNCLRAHIHKKVQEVKAEIATGCS